MIALTPGDVVVWGGLAVVVLFALLVLLLSLAVVVGGRALAKGDDTAA